MAGDDSISRAERALRTASEHFHRIVAQSALQRLMEQEMTRLAVPFEPFEKAALKHRHKAAMLFLRQTLFVNRKQGAAGDRSALASLRQMRQLSVGRTKR